MTLVLHVDGPRWRSHLERTVAANPGIVPVAKGNGYGFGLDVLLAEATRLHGAHDVRQVAVGTYAEAHHALTAHPGDVLVLEPFRAAFDTAWPDLGSPALVHTVVTVADLAALVERAGSPRVVVEGLTSMNRFGVPLAGLGPVREAVEASDAVLEGMTLHLPLGEGHLEEVSRWVEAVDVTRWYLSHITPSELATLSSRFPGKDFRPRIGTALWLGDPGALSVRAHVLEARSVATGDHAGYRQRTLRAGTLLVVSGGTAHGVALEAPSAAVTLRQRAIAVAEGVLEAAGRVRSPFTVSGRSTWFVEPPHMQVSLLSLPADAPVPSVGDEVEVRVRHTTLHADAVTIA